jgi:hypothetical protein
MRAGVLLAAVAACPVWATTDPPGAALSAARLAPVETARFNPVPFNPVRAVPSVPDPEIRPTVQGDLRQTPTWRTQRSAVAQEPKIANFKPAEPNEPSAGTPAASAKPQKSGHATPSSRAKASPATAPEPARAVELAKASEPTRAPAVARSEPAMSGDAQAVLARVLVMRDHGAAPFVIIDKRQARMWLFDEEGQPRGTTAVLLGLARGDETVPGIGDKPLARIRTGERTTPAGRFVAEPGRNARGDDVIWVDYDAAVSMHRVHSVNRGEQRLQRLSTPSVADNRISYGCINVPTAFYDNTLVPLIGGRRSVVYVLPETRPLDTLFDSSDKALAGRADQSSPKGPS